ncbi:MAG: hypothetical protein J0H68_07995 [Sphingobacteriia bacterium]|nr:hypothetical protein [Sphingobacteriia bacterium]
MAKNKRNNKGNIFGPEFESELEVQNDISIFDNILNTLGSYAKTFTNMFEQARAENKGLIIENDKLKVAIDLSISKTSQTLKPQKIVRGYEFVGKTGKVIERKEKDGKITAHVEGNFSGSIKVPNLLIDSNGKKISAKAAGTTTVIYKNGKPVCITRDGIGQNPFSDKMMQQFKSERQLHSGEREINSDERELNSDTTLRSEEVKTNNAKKVQAKPQPMVMSTAKKGFSEELSPVTSTAQNVPNQENTKKTTIQAKITTIKSNEMSVKPLIDSAKSMSDAIQKVNDAANQKSSTQEKVETPEPQKTTETNVKKPIIQAKINVTPSSEISTKPLIEAAKDMSQAIHGVNNSIKDEQMKKLADAAKNIDKNLQKLINAAKNVGDAQEVIQENNLPKPPSGKQKGR